MIIVWVSGGIGNQLFQYAFGRRMALERKVPLKLDLGRYQPDYFRHYRLGCFATQAEIIPQQELPLLRPRARYRWRLTRWLQAHLPPEYWYAVEEAQPFQVDPDILRLGRSAYLRGNWQTQGYFEPILDQIRDELRFTVEPDSDNQVMVAQIAAVEAVSLHIRRGDYANDPKVNRRFGVLPLDYYDRAVADVAAKVASPHFFVFSDDPAWAQANLRLDYPMTIVGHNGDDRDYEDLRLMSLCRHHIIANSSFSWWGAWLGQNPAKQVIAPARWYLGIDRPTPDLLPASWTRL